MFCRGVHVGNLRTLFLDTNGAFAPDSVRPESIQVEGTIKISKDNDWNGKLSLTFPAHCHATPQASNSVGPG